MEQIDGSKAELVIFNGLWSAISKLPKVIQRLVATRHLIVAEDFDAAFDSPVRVSDSRRLSTVAVVSGHEVRSAYGRIWAFRQIVCNLRTDS